MKVSIGNKKLAFPLALQVLQREGTILHYRFEDPGHYPEIIKHVFNRGKKLSKAILEAQARKLDITLYVEKI